MTISEKSLTKVIMNTGSVSILEVNQWSTSSCKRTCPRQQRQSLLISIPSFEPLQSGKYAYTSGRTNEQPADFEAPVALVRARSKKLYCVEAGDDRAASSAGNGSEAVLFQARSFAS